jgi:hypothetical protein
LAELNANERDQGGGGGGGGRVGNKFIKMCLRPASSAQRGKEGRKKDERKCIKVSFFKTVQ